jgi:8-amino-7-oxononanoate synthase
MLSKTHVRLREELAGELRGLDARGLRRSFEELPAGNFCSNDYLGLAAHPGLREEVLRAVREAPRVASTGSRLLSGHVAAWGELEEEFAQFAGSEAALYFGSGYAANLGLLTTLLGPGDVVFSDALNHASLIDGMRLSGARKIVYPHLDLNALKDTLRAHAGKICRKVIVTESVFSMDGDCAPLAPLLELAECYGAGVVVDEAHATAVHGPGGRGLVAAAGAQEQVWAIVHTCGKALASAGAFVCGSELLKQSLLNRARTQIFSTAQPPYLAGQIRAALRLAMPMDAERARLLETSQNCAAALRAAGWNTAGSASQIVPVIIGENEAALAAAAHLNEAGFAVRAIRPPSVPEGQARLRLSLTTGISDDSLEKLCAALEQWSARNQPRAAAVV